MVSLVSVVPIKCSSSGCVLLLFSVCRHLSNGDLCTESCKLRRFGFHNCRLFRLFNVWSLKSVLVLLAQILGPFGQNWVFHKIGWVFHKFTENGEFYIGWFHSLIGIIDACLELHILTIFPVLGKLTNMHLMNMVCHKYLTTWSAFKNPGIPPPPQWAKSEGEAILLQFSGFS